MCHWPRDVKSTIRKAKLPQHKPGSPWEKGWLPTTSKPHLFAMYNLYLEPFWTLLCGPCPKVARSLGICCGIFLAPCSYNCNSENLASGKTMVAPKTSNAVKSTLRQAKLPQHKPGSPWEMGWLPTTSKPHLFAMYNLYLEPFWTLLSGPCPKVASLGICCRIFLALALTTSTVKILRVARRWWLPRQAKLPLHGGWLRTWQMCHWPWSVKSRIRKAELPIHNAKPACIRKTGSYLQLRSFTFFALHSL